ncbi:MAG: carbohydrate-binding domain-containing protein [Bacteroidaceae bacterium]|nr:carbohydrate-binding domain-containing protein [Bacteroidaceae bacterium]
MKKVLFVCALLCATAMQAQQYMRVWQAGESTRYEQTTIDYSNGGGTITVAGQSYATDKVDSITIVKTIFVNWDGSTATVAVPESAQPYITVSVTGGHVVLTNTNVSEEMEFVLSGSSSNGSLTYNGQYKCKFHLNGVNLTSGVGGAMNILCGKRVDVILTPGTTNSLTDATTGDQKAAFYCKGHVEVSGAGTLAVTGRCKHAIATKEYLLLKASQGGVTIRQAASDAVHVGQYFQMNGGSLTIDANTMGDGIQVDATDDPDELNGQALIKGGTLNIVVAHEDCKGIKTGASDLGTNPAGNITISGGTINITASGNGSRGIQTDANLEINANDGTTKMDITASGGKCACGEEHKCYGIKIGDGVKGDILVKGGVTNILTSGKARAYKCDGNDGEPIITGGEFNY